MVWDIPKGVALQMILDTYVFIPQPSGGIQSKIHFFPPPPPSPTPPTPDKKNRYGPHISPTSGAPGRFSCPPQMHPKTKPPLLHPRQPGPQVASAAHPKCTPVFQDFYTNTNPLLHRRQLAPQVSSAAHTKCFPLFFENCCVKTNPPPDSWSPRSPRRPTPNVLSAFLGLLRHDQTPPPSFVADSWPGLLSGPPQMHPHLLF